MTGFSRTKATARRYESDRNVLPLLAAFVLVALTLVGAAVYVGSVRLDNLQARNEEQSVAQRLNALQQGLKTNVVDYAWWDEAIANILITPKAEWAETNLGPYVLKTFHYELALVIGNDGKPLMGWSDGVEDLKKTEAQLQPVLGQLLGSLRHADANGPTPAYGIMMTDHGPLAVAASYFAVQDDTNVTLPPGSKGALVFAKRLDQAFFSDIEQVFTLNPIRVIDQDHSIAGLANLSLLGPDNKIVGRVVWEPWHPGRSQLLWLIPALLGSMAIFALFAFLVMRSIRKTTGRIRFSETRFRDIASASSDWIWEVDAELRFTYVSDKFTTLVPIAPHLILGLPFVEVLAPLAEDRARVLACLRQGQAFRDVLFRILSRDGATRHLRLAGKVVEDANGFAGYRGIARDVTAEMMALAQATHLARHDPLTDLPNRLLLNETLQRAIQQSAGGLARYAVLLIDLDRFKEVNDSLGHGIGDMLLKVCAERLRGCVGERDLIARLGGDEFAILQADIAGPNDVERLAGRIVNALGQPCRLREHDIVIEASIGGVMMPTHGTTAERLMQHADIALYRSKVRHTFCMYEPGMEEQLHLRKTLETGLRRALIMGELELHYQPQVDAATTMIIGVEALLRWRRADDVAVPTSQLIAVAEESGLIDAIGQWVITRACQDGLAWPGINIAINVSPMQFRRGNLVDVVRRALEETGIDPRRLEIEVTENVLLTTHTVQALAIMRELKDLGISIALDDFGKGYSSLSYMKDFPFDKLKIDRSFVAGLESDQGSAAIVRAAIGLGKSFNARTCAEGVETTAQMEILRAENCEELQGYLFGKPTTPEGIDVMLKRQERACA